MTNTSANVVLPRSNECRNYTLQGEQSSRDATQSLNAATSLRNEVAAKQAEIDSIVRNFQELSKLNATSLQQIQQALQQNRQRFNSSNVKTMVTSLRTDYANQQVILQSYRDTIARLRVEIVEMKRTVDELSTLQGCG